MVRNPSEPNIFDPKCPSQLILDCIADKWALIVLCALSEGTKRYSELQRQISGVSQKMLTQTLRSLERNGLVERKVYPVVPPKVEYSLTSLAESLCDPIAAICQWAETHIQDIEAARTHYDKGDRNT